MKNSADISKNKNIKHTYSSVLSKTNTPNHFLYINAFDLLILEGFFFLVCSWGIKVYNFVSFLYVSLNVVGSAFGRFYYHDNVSLIILIGNLCPCSVFINILDKMGVILFLTVWQNLSVKPSGPVIFFVERFLITKIKFLLERHIYSDVTFCFIFCQFL